ncbi:MAG: hypothetical protein CMJ94_05935 [Planctomycetes bacterium]|nr:hypothetical protein [Planctomycetota bacterium]
MNSLFLLALNTTNATAEIGGPLQFRNELPSWVLALVVMPAIAALAFLAYRGLARPRPWRRTLALLRVALLTVALFLLLGPFLREHETRVEPTPLAILYDDSASLQRADGDGDRPRLDVLKEIAASRERAALEERYQLSSYRFSDRLSPTAADGSGIEGQGSVTALGDALLRYLSEHRGRRLPETVLVTDGRVTQGSSLNEVASRFAREGSRVHVIALGDPRPAPDLVLERVQVPDLILAGDSALFTLRLRGNIEQLPAPAVVSLHDESGAELARVRVSEWDPSGVQFGMAVVLERPGQYALHARVAPLDGELALDNNRVELPVEVKPAKIRVLYVDGEPRWEYRYLKNRLLRTETRYEREIELSCWLASAARDFVQESTPGIQALRRCPTEVETLLENFDLVILGDVDPSAISPDPLDGQRFLDAVATFVERGGGLLMLAGPRHSPDAYRGTRIEALLPVELGREQARGDAPYQALPPVANNPHPVTLLTADPEDNQAMWEAATPLWWFQPVERVRPGAQAWLVHSELGNANGPYVIAASTYAPEGWVGWIGTDETWRWRFPGGESQLSRFWRSALRHLATTRLRGAQGRVRLDLDRTQVELGEFLTVEARMRDDAYQPLQREEGVPVFLEGQDEPLVLAAVPDQIGTFRGRFRASTLGPGMVYLTASDTPEGEALASARFNVSLPSREMRETSQDEAALAALTASTGGTLVQAADASKLFAQLDGSERLTRLIASHDRPLDGRLPLLLFLVLAAAEWLLRKRQNLS